eukprot:347769-Chlamydomonas_euryale.AAC.1
MPRVGRGAMTTKAPLRTDEVFQVPSEPASLMIREYGRLSHKNEWLSLRARAAPLWPTVDAGRESIYSTKDSCPCGLGESDSVPGSSKKYLPWRGDQTVDA